MKRTTRYLVLGAIFYLAFLVVGAPSAWMAQGLKHFSQGRLGLAQTSGSLWRGQGELFIAFNSKEDRRLGRIEWRIEPWWLLLGRVQTRLQISAPDADLRGASLEGADLSRADLRGALVAGADLSRARLGGAHVSDGAMPFERELERIAELVGQARVALTSLLGVCAYVLVTTATTTDAQLALNHARMTLPLVDARLPLQQFFVGAALVTFAIGCYLHLHQARLVHALEKLPQVFPDGSPLADRVSPSLVAVALSSWFVDPEREAKDAELRSSSISRFAARVFDLGRWTRVAAFSLLWGLAPFTIGALLLRFLGSQRALQSYALWALFAAAAAASWISYLSVRKARGRTFGKGTAVATIGIAMGALACAPGVLMGIHPFRIVAPREKLSTFADGQVVGADLEKAPLVGADLRLSRLDQASLWGARLDRATLSGAVLTRAQAQLASFEGADLSLADLAGALLGAREPAQALRVEEEEALQ